jgi:hypothetical protein|tara:strand:- start:207 stop:464 length:258 start_codon:yes stop_codon:yes gene_type:complete
MLSTSQQPSPTKEKNLMSSGSADSFEKPVESVWARLEPAPSDPVFGLIHTFIDDKNPKKVLLGVGAYRDDQGQPVVLECVKKAEA